MPQHSPRHDAPIATKMLQHFPHLCQPIVHLPSIGIPIEIGFPPSLQRNRLVRYTQKGVIGRYGGKDIVLPLWHDCPPLTREYNIPIAFLCDAVALPTFQSFPTEGTGTRSVLFTGLHTTGAQLWHSHDDPNLSVRLIVSDFYASFRIPLYAFGLLCKRTARHCTLSVLSGKIAFLSINHHFADGGKATEVTSAWSAFPYLFALSQTLSVFQVSSCYSKAIFLLPRPPPLYLIDDANLRTFSLSFQIFHRLFCYLFQKTFIFAIKSTIYFRFM